MADGGWTFGRSGLLRWVGLSLSLAGLAVIVWQLSSPSALETARTLGWSFALAVAVGSIVYGAALVLLAVAWVLALEIPVRSRRVFGELCAVYLVTQIAKYLPGNVFHYVGRQALGVRAGVEHARLLRSGLTEIAGLVAAASLLHLLSAPWRRDDEFLGAGGVPVWVLALAVVAVCLVAGLGLAWWRARREGVPQVSPWRIILIMLKVMPLYLCFFACSGLILWGLGVALGYGADQPGVVVGAASAAWMFGYLTPGAPAGIGVRDAALAILLGHMAPTNVVAIGSIAYRMATLLGDVLGWLGGLALLARLRRTDPARAHLD